MKNKIKAMLLTALLTGALTVMYTTETVGADGTIYIRPDGSIDPPTAPIQRDGSIYTFLDNIYETIVIERDDILIDGNGYTLQGAGDGTGFDLSNRNNVTLKKTQIKEWKYGVHIYNQSSGNTIENNNLTNNVGRGIFLSNSSSNAIRNNTIVNNSRDAGVFLWRTNTTTITGNSISDNSEDGLSIAYASFHNTLSNNAISNNSYAGISLGFENSTGNLITGNNITENGWAGIYIAWKTNSDNEFYLNTLNNTLQVFTVDAINIWDDGYPSGGNYWSDYNGTDLYSGPFQNETGSDGIGDTSYVIDASNTDNYPLMKPYGGPHDSGITNITTSKTVVGQGYNLNITIKTINYGINTETFNLTAYANTTTIQTITDITLTSRSSTTITLTWNTTDVPCGNYTISAHATPVANETDTTDNTYVDGWVIVTIIGDVNGDGIVDASDLFDLSKAYSCELGDANWNPNCDLDGDGDVDPDDFSIFAGNYGKTF